MKYFLLFVIILSGTISCFAQTTPKDQLSIGPEYGLAAGQISSNYATVLGASVKFELPVSASQFNVTITGGITNYLVKLDYHGVLPLSSILYFPVELGGKYYFSKIAYVEGDAGVSFNANQYYTGSKTAFIYAPIIGVTAPTNKHKAAIDLGLRYEGRVENGVTVSQLALRLAYRFGI